MKLLKLSISFVFWIACIVSYGQVVPLPNAHSHNDYNHAHPLLDALSNGFTSIEADVLLIGGELYVGHDMPKGTNDLPTFKEAYLQPLDSIIKSNYGFVFPGYTEDCYLLVDFKTEAEATYRVLKEQLRPYASWLRGPGGTYASKGYVNIFLSGNRPIKTVIADKKRLVTLDGRPEDLGKGYSAEVMPVISQAYYKYSNWQGEGQRPKADQEKIKELVAATHNENKRLRLWANPDMPEGWAMLHRLGVDIINTDHLEGLRDYLLKK